eukprot:Rhum_TRINITY_DN18957_c0_g1::Rhum_TRINITY_DN18957_c0_g1_i1::g.168887::m.168887
MYSDDSSSSSETPLRPETRCDSQFIQDCEIYIDDEKPEYEDARAVLPLRNFVETMEEYGHVVLGKGKGQERYVLTTELQKLLPTDPLAAPKRAPRRFVVMDCEMLSRGAQANAETALCELTLYACTYSQEEQEWSSQQLLHELVDVGGESTTSDDAHLRSVSYQALWIHGFVGGFAGAQVVGSWGTGPEPEAAPKRYARLFKDVAAAIGSDFVLMKGGRDEPLGLAWLLHQAKQEQAAVRKALEEGTATEKEVALPKTVSFQFVDVCSEDFQRVVLSTFGYSVGGPLFTQSMILPRKPEYATYIGGVVSKEDFQKTMWDDEAGGEELFASMDSTTGFFNIKIPAQYFTSKTVTQICRIHEALWWYATVADAALCPYHCSAQEILYETTSKNGHQLGDAQRKPWHIHCSQRDTVSLCHAVQCVLSAINPLPRF